jgi:23S rRNA maturation-related 3'-5' exoribonuclease YhaM
MDEIRNKIIELLLSTKRKGINNLLAYMDTNGFFEAPCSTQYHLAKEGGLAEHSLNVYKIMYTLWYSSSEIFWHKLPSHDCMPIVSLLHDLGKMGQFGKLNYVPNLISDKKGGYIQSEKKPYETNKELLSIPHEIRSIQIASQFIELTEEENFAILHHNGLYGDLKYQLNGKERPLQMLLHFADLWCSRVVEKE